MEQEGAEDEEAGEERLAPAPEPGPRSSEDDGGESSNTDAETLTSEPRAEPGSKPAASPAARKAARDAGVALSTIKGTGRRGRVTAEDVRAASSVAPVPATPGAIAVHCRGDGPPVALYHGLFDDARGWRMIPGRLKAAGHKALSFDLPGHGASEATAESFEEAASLLHDALVREVPKGPIRLAGHSLGAALAARVAGRLGPRAGGLTLIAPAGLGPRISEEFIEGMSAARTAPALARAIALLDGGPLSQDAMAEEAERHAAGIAPRTALARAVASDGFQQIDLRAEIAALSCPIACLWGTADRVLDWRDVQHLPASARIHLVPGAGHLPHHAEPALAAELIAGDEV